jgi:hypothetical protein
MYCAVRYRQLKGGQGGANNAEKKALLEQTTRRIRAMTPKEREQMLRAIFAQLQAVAQSQQQGVLQGLTPVEKHLFQLHRMQKQQKQQQQLVAQQHHQRQMLTAGGQPAAPMLGVAPTALAQQPEAIPMAGVTSAAAVQPQPPTQDLLGNMADRL